MKLRMRYFARLREAFAMAEETPLAPVRTLSELLDWLRLRGGPWAVELVPGRAYRVAVNQELVEGEALLHENDEVAIFPPVTGG